MKTKIDNIKKANKFLFEMGNIDILPEMFASNYQAHSNRKKYLGHEFIKRWIKQLRNAIHDIRVVDEIFFVNSDDTVVWQRTLKGKHVQKLRGIPPSGKIIIWNELVVSRFENNLISEEWIVSELLGQLMVKK